MVVIPVKAGIQRLKTLDTKTFLLENIGIYKIIRCNFCLTGLPRLLSGDIRVKKQRH
jgi:hypothetical protein